MKKLIISIIFMLSALIAFSQTNDRFSHQVTLNDNLHKKNTIQFHVGSILLISNIGISYERTFASNKWSHGVLKLGIQGHYHLGIFTDGQYGFALPLEIGMKIGSDQNFFDVFIGAGPYSLKETYSNDVYVLPMVFTEIAYRRQNYNGSIFRLGLSIPKGIFISFGGAF